MKKITLLLFTSIPVFAALSFSFCGSKAAKNESMSINNKGFAVVELFTSEGCSSCPPADEAMINLAKEFPQHVYFLGYHVDYWDYIGWKDEFSNADYTKRQNNYAEQFGLNSIYTPQAIVNGANELVGSKESQLRSIIREKLNTDSSLLNDPITIGLTAKKNESNNISVSCKVNNAGKSELNIALVQLMATTNVKRGENNGRKLNHINVVRDLKASSVDKDANASVIFEIPSGLTAKDLKVIAFVQNKKDMKIVGASESPIQ
jgi:hypothetical protein